jgi:hypothetical protein
LGRPQNQHFFSFDGMTSILFVSLFFSRYKTKTTLHPTITMVAGLGRKSNLPAQLKTTRPSKDVNRTNRLRVDNFNSKAHSYSARKSRIPTPLPETPPPPPPRLVPIRTSVSANPSLARKQSTMNGNDSLILVAQRRYVVRHQMCPSVSSYCSLDESPDEVLVSGILDGITSLCFGGLPPTYLNGKPQSRGVGGSSCSTGGGLIKPTSRNISHRMSSSSSSSFPKKKVVYPIARYPAQLNCQKLVSERRRAFQHNLFRPVSNDEMSAY